MRYFYFQWLSPCHPGAGRGPEFISWIPAFAGMTPNWVFWDNLKTYANHNRVNPVCLKHLRVRFGQRIVHRFWQPGGGFYRNIFTMDKLKRAMEYIEHNPVRRGLAEAPIDWPWSSARAHAGMKDVAISIDPIEFPVRSSERDGRTP